MSARSRVRRSLAIASSVTSGSVVPLAAAAVLGTALTIALSPGQTIEADALGLDGIDPTIAWLNLAVLVLGVTSLASTIESWPGFGRGHPGRGMVDRLQPGALDGCVQASVTAVLLNAVFATLVLLALLSSGFGPIEDEEDSVPGNRSEGAAVHEVATLLPLRSEDLGTDLATAVGPGRPIAEWRLPARAGFEQIELRPRIVVTESGLGPANLRIWFDDQDPALAGTICQIERNGERLRLPMPSGAKTLHLERLADSGLALAFPDDSSTAVRPIDRSRTLNLIYAISIASAGLFAAFGAGCVLRRFVRRDLLAGTSVGIFLFLTLIGLAPQVPALAAAARAESALGPDTQHGVFWSLSIGGGLMLFGVSPRFLRQPWLRRAT